MRSCFALLAALAALSIAACDSEGTPGATNLGISGASCLRTPDCAPPLQCIAQVCTAVGAGADASLPDAGGTWPLADVAAEPDVPEDRVVVHEIVTAYDVSGWDLVDVPKPDVPGPTDAANPGYDTLFGDCEELGIGPNWEGVFFGSIDFDLVDTTGLIYPTQGTIFVMGDLGFTISCIESKLVVDGDVTGTATVEDQGDFPFTIAIRGFYDPKTGELSANMVDGVVTVYGLVEIYFLGTFGGVLGADKTFTGTWDGEAAGTNLGELITGTATGHGTWAAEPPVGP